MSHMEPTTRVGEHGEAIELLFAGVLGDFKTFGFLPVVLDFFFNLVGLVLFFHLGRHLSVLDWLNG